MKILISLALLFLIIALNATSQAGYGTDAPEVFNLQAASENSPNLPDANAIKILTEAFENAKAVLADGDLRLGSRWNCRELFAEADGRSNYRFRAFSFQLYDSGILEDTLNVSPKLYSHTKAGLVGQSALAAKKATEIRVDEEGNLRMAVKKDGRYSSFVVCLLKNLHHAQ